MADLHYDPAKPASQHANRELSHLERGLDLHVVTEQEVYHRMAELARMEALAIVSAASKPDHD